MFHFCILYDFLLMSRGVLIYANKHDTGKKDAAVYSIGKDLLFMP